MVSAIEIGHSPPKKKTRKSWSYFGAKFSWKVSKLLLNCAKLTLLIVNFWHHLGHDIILHPNILLVHTAHKGRKIYAWFISLESQKAIMQVCHWIFNLFNFQIILGFKWSWNIHCLLMIFYLMMPLVHECISSWIVCLWLFIREKYVYSKPWNRPVISI